MLIHVNEAWEKRFIFFQGCIHEDFKTDYLFISFLELLTFRKPGLKMVEADIIVFLTEFLFLHWKGTLGNESSIILLHNS